MNFSETRTTQLLMCMAFASCLFAPASVLSADSADATAERAAVEAEQAAMAAERAALEAESQARQKALLEAIAQTRLKADRAAEEARRRAEQLRADTERLRAEREHQTREVGERRMEQLEEIARLREDLSRTHSELRKAQREVARANRDLAMTEDHRVTARLINLGDRKLIGVVLGEETSDGIVVRGVSPDGPAEEAGIKTGDVLISLRGESLAPSEDRKSRDMVYEIMGQVGEDEEISATVLRDGSHWEFMVAPERREPASWQSHIRLPAAPLPPGDVEIVSAGPSFIVERIAVPHVDEAELAAEVARIEKDLENLDFVYIDEDVDSLDYSMDFAFPEGFDLEFDAEGFSTIGSMAMDEASVWYATPFAHGVRLAEINAGLGDYFKTDRGALVLEAPHDNPFKLQAGDVVLSIGDSEVNSTSDFVRALRQFEPGESFTLAIKRNKRDKTLEAELPESRYSFKYDDFLRHSDSKYAPPAKKD